MPSDFVLTPFWAIEPAWFDSMTKQFERSAYMRPADDDDDSPMSIENGVAVIGINGVMTKNASFFSRMTGGFGSSDIARAVKQAASDPNVKAIMLRIDSPGGTVDGTAELADAVAEARESKQIVAQVDGLAASAAYWVASQAHAIYSHRTDMVGSIGTRIMLYDYSRLFQNAGIEAVPIDTGPYKSAGAFGAEITADQRAYFQEIVDKTNAEFAMAVKAGRGMTDEQFKAVGDGRVFVAKDAKKLGLINGVQDSQKTLAGLQKSSGRQSQTGGRRAMSDSAVLETAAPVAPQAATYEQLVSACPGASNDFICAQLKDKATEAQAIRAYMKSQAEELAKAKADAEAAKQAAQSAADRPGVPPATTATKKVADTDAISEFEGRVAENIKLGMNRDRATAKVVREDPDLHQSYIAAFNAARR